MFDRTFLLLCIALAGVTAVIGLAVMSSCTGIAGMF